MDVIVTEHLTRRFGDLVAVDDLSLTVRAGEVFGLLGPNGAGKTTTLRMIAGLIGPTAGAVTVAGVPLTDDARQAQRARGLVGVLPEEVGLYGDLPVARTLAFFATLYGMPRGAAADRIEALLTRLGLWDRRDEPAGTLSKGLKQRLGLARALIHDPPVVLLDEPTANLDPEAAALVRDVLGELRDDGRAVVVNTHRLDEAQRSCDRVGVLRGRLIAIGAPERLGGDATAVRVRVETDRWEPALTAAVESIGGSVAGVEGGTATVELATGGPGAPELVAALVSAGAAIRAVVPEKRSLEDAYLGILGEGR